MSEPAPDSRWTFRHRLTVRFSDCDMLGHVNNAVYLSYLEECRIEWWKAIGEPPISGGSGVGAIMAHASLNYRAPLFLSDEVEIRLAVHKVGTSSVTVDYELVNVATGVVVADARTVAVAFDFGQNRTVPVSPETRERMLSRPPAV